MSLFLDSEFHSSDMYVHLYASAMQFWLLWKWKWKLLSRVWLFVTPWTIPHGILQARILEFINYNEMHIFFFFNSLILIVPFLEYPYKHV